MALVQMEVDLSHFRLTMEEAEAAFADMTELTTVLSAQAVRMIDRKFQRSGPGWVPLSQRALKRRRQGGAGAKPLLDTGKLRASTTGGNGGVLVVDSTSFVVGTNLEYASAHQFGIASRGLPARPFIPSEAELVAAFRPTVIRYAHDKLSGQ